MKISDNQPKFIVINKQANSLYSVIADGKYRSTLLGRETWKSLIGSEASLQHNCNREGFNANSDRKQNSKERIGILFNNENECKSCDSRIGFGTGGYPDDSNTCGNEALAEYKADNGDKHIKAMGYILVQWKQIKQRKHMFVKVFCLSRSHTMCFIHRKIVIYIDVVWYELQFVYQP